MAIKLGWGHEERKQEYTVRQVTPISTATSLFNKAGPRYSLYYKKIDLKGWKEILSPAMHKVLVDGPMQQNVIEADSLDQTCDRYGIKFTLAVTQEMDQVLIKHE